MKKLVFIGSRIHVYNAAISMGIEFSKVYTLKNSFIERQLIKSGDDFISFTMDDRAAVLKELVNFDFDILISNGCPIIFPVEKFGSNKLLLNIHPTYLPHLQGKTPLNGIFYLDYKFYGATMHFIDKGIDTGNIIYQLKEDITEDLDLGLLYHLSFKLEGEVFKKGWKKLLETNFKFDGYRQIGNKSYFNRTPKKQQIDFEEMPTEIILRKVRSFNLLSQGSTAIINGIKHIIFEASKIIHSPLIKSAQDFKPGEVYLEYNGKILIKTIDGLIRIDRCKKDN